MLRGNESQKKTPFHLGIAQIFKSEQVDQIACMGVGAGGWEGNLHNSQKKG